MKKNKRYMAMAAGVLAISTLAFDANAQISDDAVRIGFITDMSGLYSYLDGMGGLEAMKMAVEDFGGTVLGKPIELVSADHQNKADIAAAKARKWMDQDGLDALFGGANSAAALAMSQVAAEKKRTYINIGAGSARLTNEECTPYTIHYAYDTVALAKGTGAAAVKQGNKSWFFLTADYAFGHSLENDTSAVVKANGGTVVGAVRHPLSTSDFSSFMLQAQASQAQILGLANAGADTINSIKSANAFRVNKSMKIAGLLMFLNDIHSLGLETAQGLLMTSSWYWDKDDASRAFANRFFDRMNTMPNSIQAANYSAITSYLKAVQAVGTDDSDKVVAELKRMKIDDFYTKGTIRADGRGIHDMYLLQVKKPSESKKPWDYLEMIATIPGEQAFTTVAESKCALLKP